MVDNYFVTFFPNLCLREVDEIDFGFAKVWNFDRKKDNYITDSAIKDKLTRIMQTHKSDSGQFTKGIGVISIGPTDFRHFNKDELELAKSVRLLLFLCFLSLNNIHKADPNVGHQMATSENFDLVYHNFVLNQDFVGDQSGAIVNILRGHGLGQVTYQKPSYVLTPMRFKLDEELLNQLSQVRARQPQIFARIINATEIFLEGYYNSPYVSNNARTLLQLSAFEILLNLPSEQQRMHFKQVIKSLAGLAGEPTFSHFSERHGKQVEEQLTMKEIWADTFYVLRNHIIHGDKISPEEVAFQNQQPHTDIAVQFFVLAVKKEVEKTLPDCPCNFEITWEEWEDNISRPEPFMRKGFVYSYSRRKLWEKLVGKNSFNDGPAKLSQNTPQ